MKHRATRSQVLMFRQRLSMRATGNASLLPSFSCGRSGRQTRPDPAPYWRHPPPDAAAVADRIGRPTGRRWRRPTPRSPVRRREPGRWLRPASALGPAAEISPHSLCAVFPTNGLRSGVNPQRRRWLTHRCDERWQRRLPATGSSLSPARS